MAFDQSNLFWDFLEADPEGQRANYFGRLQSQPRKSPNQRKFFEGQFQEIQNRYLGQLGQMVQGGQSPTKTLSGFLQDYFMQGGGADEDWMNNGLRERSGSANRFAPSTRWMV